MVKLFQKCELSIRCSASETRPEITISAVFNDKVSAADVEHALYVTGLLQSLIGRFMRKHLSKGPEIQTLDDVWCQGSWDGIDEHDPVRENFFSELVKVSSTYGPVVLDKVVDRIAEVAAKERHHMATFCVAIKDSKLGIVKFDFNVHRIMHACNRRQLVIEMRRMRNF